MERQIVSAPRSYYRRQAVWRSDPDRVGGAVVDTWYRYPSAAEPAPRPSHHAFHELPNVMMTPHLSGWTEGLMPRRFEVIIDNLERLADGHPLRHQVHPPVAA